MENENLFKHTLKQIQERQERLKQGHINAIPYPFPKLNQYLPGIIPEFMTVTTCVSGAGKTLIENALHVQGPYDYWKLHGQKKDFDIKIFLFCLEDSTLLTQKRMILRKLYLDKGIRMGMFKLNGYMEGSAIDDATMRLISSYDSYFEEFYSKVELIDDVTNPTGIFKKVENWLLKPENGYIVDAKGNKLSSKEIEECKENHVETFYKSTNPNRIVIVAIDNMNNVTEEKGCDTKWDALDKLSRVYLRKKLVNYYKCFVSMIAQQDKSKEKTQYTNSGGIVEDKFVPSLDSISVYKNIDNSAHAVFSLFDPSRYKIEKFQNVDITRMDTYYRNFSILKSNFAQVGLNVGLFFDGVSGIVEELPSAKEDQAALIPYYERAQKLMKENAGLKALKI